MSPSLFAIPRFSWIFLCVARVGAARLRAAAARLREERLIGHVNGDASVGKVIATGWWQVFLIQSRAKRLIEGYAEKSCLHRGWETEK